MKDHHEGKQGKRGAKKGARRVGIVFVFLFGFTGGLGTAAVGAYYLNQVPLPFVAPPTRQGDDGILGGVKDEKEEMLEFHKILRAREAPQSAQEPEEVVTPTTAEPEDSGVFFLQAGSFRSRGSADALRGELALLDQAASVRQHRLSGGDVTYRVLLGPFPSSEAAENIRAQLAFSGYNVSLLRAGE